MSQNRGDKKPYQFYVNESVRVNAKKKAKRNGVKLNEFMVMAMEKFASQPIEESLAQLRKHNRRKER